MNKKTKQLVILANKANTEEFNILKVIEEASELNEVLTKTLTKRGKDKPSKEKLAEEAGDLFLRLEILKPFIGTQLVDQRIIQKRQILIDHYKTKLNAKNKPTT